MENGKYSTEGVWIVSELVQLSIVMKSDEKLHFRSQLFIMASVRFWPKIMLQGHIVLEHK